MKHLYYLLVLLLAVVQQVSAQNQWAWMNGDKSPNLTSNYGTQGIESISNIPGSRVGAASWTDKDGNLWMFGGNGKGTGTRSGYLSDLWKFNTSTGLWTWMGGNKSTNNTGIYTNKGTASAKNLPGSRMNAVAWTDSRGNFWLFGGEGMVSNKEKKEENNTPDPTPNPGNGNNGGGNGGNNKDDDDDGGRGNGNGNNGNHGEGNNGNGNGRDKDKDKDKDDKGHDSELESSAEGLLSDLWMYSPSTKEWTWVSGNDKVNGKGEYGEKNQAKASNRPGGRTQAGGWSDSNGNLWLFGGYGFSSKGSASHLNDLWKYSPSVNQWTWMKGSNNENTDAHFGDKGTFANENSPHSRRGSTVWLDGEGNFWMFGGGAGNELYSDLWKFKPQSNEWAWMSGSKDADHAPSFKFKGVPDRDGNPGARIMASGWSDTKGNLWLFGGTGYGKQTGSSFVNNLWLYDVTTNEWTFVKGEAAVSSDAVFGSKGEMSNASTPGGTANYARWRDKQGNFWLFGGQSSNGFLNQTWKFAACVGEVTGSISPTTASVCGGGSQQLTASGGSSYQWLLNDEVIEGQTNSTITVSQPGSYSVIIKNGGCSGTATNKAVVTNSSVAGIRYTDIFTTANSPVQLNAREIGVAYEWTPAIGINNPSSAKPMVTVNAEREYVVNITTAEGCTTSDTVLVKIATGGEKKSVVVPTAFTPDGNGINDRLRPLGNIVTLEYFRVFNRWGAMLFQTSEWGDGWDGKYKGVAQPAETYTWMLSGKTADGQLIKLSGKTLLIR